MMIFLRKHMKKEFVLNCLIALIAAVQAGFFIYSVFFLINPSMVDMAGHFGSAQIFSQGYFHAYDDNNFLGYIHNLFYPPLQDFLITVIAFFTSRDFILAGKIYLVLSFLFFLFSVYVFSKNFKSALASFLFLFFVFFWLNISQLNLEEQVFQGLTIFDTLGVGLITQFLGTGFLFFLLHKSWQAKNPYSIAILLAMCFYSHVLSAIIGVMTLVILGCFRKNRQIFLGLFLGILISAAFWLPFLVSIPMASSGLIYDSVTTRSGTFLIFSALPILVFYLLRTPFFPIFSFIAFLLFLINIVGSYFLQQHDIKIFPHFHYYRTLVYAVFFLVIDICFFIARSSKDSKLLPLGLVFYFANIFLIFMINFMPNFKQKIVYAPLTIESFFWPNRPSQGQPEIQRTLFGSHVDPNDQNIAEYFRAQQLGVRTANGVYWESSKGNPLFVSYYASLFKENKGILDFFSLNIPNCEVYVCFVDQFIRDFNLSFMVFDKDLMNRNTLPSATKACFQKMLTTEETSLFFLKPSGHFQTSITGSDGAKNFYNYKIYQLVDKGELSKKQSLLFNQNTVEAIEKTNIHFYPKEQNVLVSYLTKVSETCQKGGNNAQVDLADTTQGQLLKTPNIEDIGKITDATFLSLKKIQKNTYEVFVENEKPIFFKIKLNYFDGWVLRNSAGETLPLVSGLGYMVGFGQGKMLLTYERPTIFLMSYLIAFLGLFLTLCLWLLQRKKSIK